MQPPTDVGRKLHCLRPGQQHAEVERWQKLALLDPPLLVNENAMHEGDLSGWTTKRQKAELRPHGDSFAERRHNDLSATTCLCYLCHFLTAPGREAA